jgi:2-hydroxy-3-oxopropionate reductase
MVNAGADRQEGRIAFLGTGLMGGPMAARLLDRGHELVVWNRTAEKTQPLVERGATRAESPEAAAAGSRLLITMLADGPTVTDVLFGSGLAGSLPPDAIMVDMSSIPPDLAREHERLLAAMGIGHLDAPVSGGTKGATEGSLAIMVGGSPAAFETVRPVFEAMGRPTLVGPAGAGQLTKLANQAIVATTICAVAEAFLLTSAGGADPAKVREALSGGFADSPILRQHGQRMIDRAWSPGGPLWAQAKDTRTIISVAAALKLDLPLTGLVSALFEAALPDFAHLDHSALLLQLERRNPGFHVSHKPDRDPDLERP